MQKRPMSLRADEEGRADLWRCCERLVELGYQPTIVQSRAEFMRVTGQITLADFRRANVRLDELAGRIGRVGPFTVGMEGRRIYFQPPRYEATEQG
jgi:hypothetical protein